VALVIARAEADKEAIEDRRSKDRERQAKRRASRDITLGTVTLCDNADETPSLDKEIPPKPPKEIKPNPARIALTRKAAGFGPPKGVEVGLWNTFCGQRKKALTEVAYDRLCGKLAECGDAGWPPGEMIGKAIERGWETVFVPSEKKNGQHNGTTQHGSNSTSRTRAAVLSLLDSDPRFAPEPDFASLRSVGSSRGD
jgi:hypothetical protein